MSDFTYTPDPTECQDWEVTWPCTVEGIDPDLLAAARAAAQSIVWAVLGRRHGFCSTVALIDNATWWQVCGSGLWSPYIVDGRIRNCPAPGREGCCSLRLPHRDVVEVTSVTIGGVVVDPESYFLHSDGTLRSSGGCWPTHGQCEESPIEVTYVHGVAPPPGADMAVGEVGCEILAPYRGEVCKLPSRAVSISRNGISIDLGDPTVLLEAGLWGLPILDALIKSVNPNKLQMRSGVASPDHRMRS